MLLFLEIWQISTSCIYIFIVKNLLKILFSLLNSSQHVLYMTVFFQTYHPALVQSESEKKILLFVWWLHFPTKNHLNVWIKQKYTHFFFGFGLSITHMSQGLSSIRLKTQIKWFPNVYYWLTAESVECLNKSIHAYNLLFCSSCSLTLFVSFEIVSDWKLPLTRLHVLSLISLAHRTTKLPFSLPQEQIYMTFICSG